MFKNVYGIEAKIIKTIEITVSLRDSSVIGLNKITK